MRVTGVLFFSGVGEAVCVGVHTAVRTRYTRALNTEAWEEERLFQFYFEIVFLRQNRRLKWQLFIRKSDCRLENPHVHIVPWNDSCRITWAQAQSAAWASGTSVVLLCVVLGVVSFWGALGFAFCMFTP